MESEEVKSRRKVKLFYRLNIFILFLWYLMTKFVCVNLFWMPFAKGEAAGFGLVMFLVYYFLSLCFLSLLSLLVSMFALEYIKKIKFQSTKARIVVVTSWIQSILTVVAWLVFFGGVYMLFL